MHETISFLVSCVLVYIKIVTNRTSMSGDNLPGRLLVPLTWCKVKRTDFAKVLQMLLDWKRHSGGISLKVFLLGLVLIPWCCMWKRDIEASQRWPWSGAIVLRIMSAPARDSWGLYRVPCYGNGVTRDGGARASLSDHGSETARVCLDSAVENSSKGYVFLL